MRTSESFERRAQQSVSTLTDQALIAFEIEHERVIYILNTKCIKYIMYKFKIESFKRRIDSTTKCKR